MEIVAHERSRRDTHSYAPALESARAAREFVRETLRLAGVDDAVAQVLVSELAGNAIRHARTRFEVRVILADRRVRVEVEDEDPDVGGVAGPWKRRTGYGLTLVEGLATRWGAQRFRDGKVVWFELPQVPAPAA